MRVKAKRSDELAYAIFGDEILEVVDTKTFMKNDMYKFNGFLNWHNQNGFKQVKGDKRE